MPSCFYSEQLARYRNSLLRIFESLPKKDGNPHYFSYKSEKAHFAFPRFQREDRRHSYINPISFFFLSKTLSDNYIALRSLNKKSALSIAPSILDWSGERALIRPLFDVREAQIADLNARHEYLVEVDINAFYHSIYTHTIPWAIHGKSIAKKNRGYGLVGNLLDLLVRNAQDEQTIGIPVGPDTSRFIAEIVGTAVDRVIQKALKKRTWSARDRSGMRFVDDYLFGCSSFQEAESVMASVRKSINEFELELNSSKTKVQPSGPFYRPAWREHIRSLLPLQPYTKEELARYFYNVHITSAHNESADVVKFSVQIARRAFLETDAWQVVDDFLLSAYRLNPTIVDVMVELFILRSLAKGDVSIGRLGAFVSSRLPELIASQKIGEVCWLLFLCIALKVSVKAATLAELFSVEDGAAAILVSDAGRAGLITGKIDQSTWNRSLTADGLNSSMWLYAYESTLKKLNGVASEAHVTGHRR
jgi:hypothetical protein